MSPRFLIFVSVAALLVLLAHGYVYVRFFRDTASPRWMRPVAAAGLALLAAGSLAWPFLGGSSFAWLWLGVLTVLVAVLVPLDAARWMASLGARLTQGPRPAVAAASGEGAPAPAPEDALGRRVVLARGLAAGAALTTASLVGYGRWRTFHPPELSELAVRLPRLPRALDGLRLVQLSDIHVGGSIRRPFMDELVARVNRLFPDVVVVTGDLVDGSVAALGHSVSALSNVRARFGTWFVTGNHEYYSGDQAWAPALEQMGLGVLRNRTVGLGDVGGRLDLVGVDDWSMRAAGGYDLGKALAGRSPDSPAILLAHQPENFEAAVAEGIGLQLSGHTHGGQLYPGTLVVSAVHRYPAGHYTHGEGHLYVSRGTGFWGPPLRIGSPPEIVVVSLLA